MANDILIDNALSSALTRIDGLVLLSFFVIFIYYSFTIAKHIEGTEDLFPRKELNTSKILSLILLGLTGLIFGGKFVVDGAVGLASALGVNQSIIGLTIVAIGTSLPELGQALSYWITVLSIFGGIILIGVIDRLIPSFENPHHIHRIKEMDEPTRGKEFRDLYRMGLFTAMAIAIHNFPEGLATFASALKNLRLGIPIAVAISTGFV
jgi:hypothetical protein